MEGVPVRYLGADTRAVPSYVVVGIAALARALLHSRINVYDARTAELLSCLQNVHDAFGTQEWRDRLASIARQFGLSAELLKSAA
jgi:hypothetical protein